MNIQLTIDNSPEEHRDNFQMMVDSGIDAIVIVRNLFDERLIPLSDAVEYAMSQTEENRVKFLSVRLLEDEPEICIEIYNSLDKNVIVSSIHNCNIISLSAQRMIPIIVAAGDYDKFCQVGDVVMTLYILRGSCLNKQELDWLDMDVEELKLISYLSKTILLKNHSASNIYQLMFEKVRDKMGCTKESLAERLYYYTIEYPSTNYYESYLVRGNDRAKHEMLYRAGFIYDEIREMKDNGKKEKWLSYTDV